MYLYCYFLLGVAFNNLKEHELYPMISSTAAKSKAHLCCAITEKSSLQLFCLKVIRDEPRLKATLDRIPGFQDAFKERYFWFMTEKMQGKWAMSKTSLLFVCILMLSLSVWFIRREIRVFCGIQCLNFKFSLDLSHA